MRQSIQQPILTITQLNQQVRFLLEQSFPTIWVEGEISNFSAPSSGHWYFSLKDSNCQIRCALFRGQQKNILFKPQDGSHVLARAKVSLYEGRGEFQLIVEHLEEAGFGKLQRQFEQLKAKLLQEGLFAAELKKSLPYLPKQIGIITSPTGAAIRDILHVLERRFPAIPVIIYPTLVQGEEAAQQIAKAIEIANQRNECDVLILARGGGSLEDLWSFNEEIVARAIFASQIPLISAIGHQVDTTIADFVADIRAATPSAAAEIVAPEQTQLLLEVKQNKPRLINLLKRILQEKQQKLDWLEHRLKQQHPTQRIATQEKQIEQILQRLKNSIQIKYQQQQQRLDILSSKLQRHHPINLISSQRQHLHTLQKSLLTSMKQLHWNKLQHFTQLVRVLQNISPLATLARGYAIAKNQTGAVILKETDVKVGETLSIERDHFSLNCEVLSIKRLE